MKRFLCYDTNDAASDRVNVDSRGMLRPNSTVPSTNGSTNQHLVTDSNGNMKWEDRLAYEGSRVVVVGGKDDQFVKVADEVPSWLSVDTDVKCWLNDGKSSTLSPPYIAHSNGSFIALLNKIIPVIAVITEDNIEFYLDESEIILFPEKGVYFLYFKFGSGTIQYVTGIASTDSNTPEITWDGNTSMIKKLDKKFLPDQTVFYALPNKRLIDAPGGVYITLEQAKAAGLNFVIQTIYGIAKPIFVSYDDASATFYAAEMTDSSGEHYSFTQFFAGVGDGPV